MQLFVKTFPQSVLDIEHRKIRLFGENNILYLLICKSLPVRKLKREILRNNPHTKVI